MGIDGPSGSGKSSTSRGVAARFGFDYLDTGAMYRACTWAMLEAGLTDPIQITDLVRTAALDIGTDPAHPTFAVNGTDVTEAIREPRVSEAVSRLATIPAVREELVARQQAIVAAERVGIVVEGRDVTTVIAPDAQVRVLLTADPQARMARRAAELGDRVDQAAVQDQVLRRDRDDATVAQFETAANGVVTIDSTSMGLDDVIDTVAALVTAAQQDSHE